MTKIASIFALILLSMSFVSAQSALDGFDPNANGFVRAIVVQPDGKILIGGDFTTVSPNGGAAVTRNRIARFNPNGTLDTAFNPNADGNIYAIAVQADGKILAGGVFDNIGGQARTRLARLDATTGAADSFAPNANSTVLTIVIQSDGKILAGGSFGTIGGQTRNRIARLDQTTGLADGFNPNANFAVYAIAVQSDGRVLAGGDFTTLQPNGAPAPTTRNRIARLNADGTLDTVFNPNASDIVRSIAVQVDGKIVAGGDFNGATGIGGQPRNYIARLDQTTGAADSWNPNSSAIVYRIAIQLDGKILAGGAFNGANSIGGQTRNRIARLDAVTGLADAFDPNANSTVLIIAVQQDGKILVGGQFTTISGQARTFVARLERDGRLDQTLNIFASGPYVLATAIQPDGKILIGGSFSNILGSARNNIARLNSDGTLDTSFNPNVNSEVYSIAIQSDGKILLGGVFTALSPNGGAAVTRNRIARVNADGTLDTAFDPNASSAVYSIAVQSDGKILLGGNFNALAPNGGATVTRNRIARVNADGTLDTAFNPNASNDVYAIAVQSDGRILLGGLFTTLSPNGGAAVTRNRIARVNADGTLDTTFNPNAGSSVYSIAVQSDGKILLGGIFTTLSPNGGAAVTRNRIARVNADGTLDTAFNPNATNEVDSIAVQSDGKILLSGGFTSLSPNGGAAVTRNFIARVNADGTLDAAFNPNASSSVYSIAVQTDGKILAGGQFTTIGGQSRSLFARLSNDTAARSTLAVTTTNLTLTRDGSASQFSRVIFEQSIDNGATYTLLGTATNSFAPLASKTKVDDQFAPLAAGYTLGGLSLPTAQNVLIRARGFYRSGYQSGSETTEDKVQIAYLSVPTAANVSVSGRVLTPNGNGLRNAIVHLTDIQGNTRTVHSGSFGFYRFDAVEAGQTYVIGVASKRYVFSPRTISVSDELTELDFIAQ